MPDRPGRTLWRVLLAAAVVVVLVAGGIRCGREAAAGPPPLRPVPGPTLDLGRMSPLRVDTVPQVLSVEEAVQVGERWLVLDPVAHRLHVLGPAGHVVSFGREGEGPGELIRPGDLDVGAGVAAVVDRFGSRIDFFDLQGGFRGRRDIRAADCPLSIPREILASPSGSFLLLERCTDPGRGTRARIREVGLEAEPRILWDDAPSSGRTLLDAPLLGRHRGGFVVGTTGDPCLSPLDDAAGTGLRGVCHPRHRGAPLPDSMRPALEAIAERSARTGVRMRVPDHLPPLSGLSSTPDRLVFRVPLEDGGEVLDVLYGARLVRVVPPAGGRVFVGRDRILVARDLLHGAEIRVIAAPVAWADPAGPGR